MAGQSPDRRWIDMQDLRESCRLSLAERSAALLNMGVKVVDRFGQPYLGPIRATSAGQ